MKMKRTTLKCFALCFVLLGILVIAYLHQTGIGLIIPAWAQDQTIRYGTLHYRRPAPLCQSRQMNNAENDSVWPEMQLAIVPGMVPSVLHYTWCGNKKFRFKDYLSVLSAIKIFEPLKVVFHFTHEPQTDDYNSWFKELKSSEAALELQKLSPAPSCGSKDLLKTALGFLSAEGGIYLSENVIISRAPKDLPKDSSPWFASSGNAALVVVNAGFNESMKNVYLEKISSPGTASRKCSSVSDYNLSSRDKHCVIVPDVVYPLNIIDAHTSFAELARWLYYGRRAPAVPEQDSRNLIPRITHYVRMKGKKNGVYDEFAFSHFMSVLSALYIGGFEHVYLHVDEEPRGQWWDELAKEKNITVVKGIRPDTVYQNKVNLIQHVSDIQRYLILYKYGGAYQDFDVFWTSRVPDSLLSLPFVASNDWARLDNDFPEAFNLGVMLSRPQAEWLDYFLQSHKDFRDQDWGFNSLRMSYKTYEQHPHLMYLDRRLQVLCCNGICHPAWEKGFFRPMSNHSPTIPFRWQNVSTIHVTCNQPHPDMSSPATVKKGKNMYADIGRFVLEKSGRKHLLA